MSVEKGQIGFLRTLFPCRKVEIRQQPSLNAASVAAAKSGDKVLILETERAAHSRQIWYCVFHEKSESKGWIPAKKVFVLKTINQENSANLRDTNQEKNIHQGDSFESIQTFKMSQSLVFGMKFIPKYHR